MGGIEEHLKHQNNFYIYECLCLDFIYQIIIPDRNEFLSGIFITSFGYYFSSAGNTFTPAECLSLFDLHSRPSFPTLGKEQRIERDAHEKSRARWRNLTFRSGNSNDYSVTDPRARDIQRARHSRFVRSRYVNPVLLLCTSLPSADSFVLHDSPLTFDDLRMIPRNPCSHRSTDRLWSFHVLPRSFSPASTLFSRLKQILNLSKRT